MSDRIGNRFIDLLSPDLFHLVLQSSRTIELPVRTPLYSDGAQPKHVYFLTEGFASVVVSARNGGSVEVGMIGCEGLTGSGSLLGPSAIKADCFMQMAGKGWSMPEHVARRLFEERKEFRSLVLEFVQSQISISCRIAACNRVHEAQARLSRWLLTAADRSGTETLHLTQEFLAQMLGTQRTTVALVAGILQRKGLIGYSRGEVRILDREHLKREACDCYEVTEHEIRTLYNPYPQTGVENKPIPLAEVANGLHDPLPAR